MHGEGTPGSDLVSLQWQAPPRNILMVKKDGAPSVTESLIEYAKYVFQRIHTEETADQTGTSTLIMIMYHSYSSQMSRHSYTNSSPSQYTQRPRMELSQQKLTWPQRLEEMGPFYTHHPYSAQKSTCHQYYLSVWEHWGS